MKDWLKREWNKPLSLSEQMQGLAGLVVLGFLVWLFVAGPNCGVDEMDEARDQFTPHEMDLLCDLWHHSEFDDERARRYWQRTWPNEWVTFAEVKGVKNECQNTP